MPVLTVVIAFLIGGLVVLATGHNPLLAYRDIFNGAGLNWVFHPTTDIASTSAYNLSQTLLQTTTLILTGLAVAFAFRCGMFNIGGQGQYFVGLYVANWLGYSLAGMQPAAAHPDRGRRRDARRCRVGRDRRLPEGDRRRARGDLDDHAELDRDLGRRSGCSATAARSRTAANSSVPISNDIAPSAQLPVFWGDQGLQGLHIGLLRRARRARRVLRCILNRTTLGYEVRAVGFNPEAAAYGGISVKKNLIRAMAISGAFAGLAGALDMLGYLYHFGTSDIPVELGRLPRHRRRAARPEHRRRRRLRRRCSSGRCSSGRRTGCRRT